MHFPKHKAGLTLSHNDHLASYQSVREYTDSDTGLNPDWVSSYEREKAGAEGSLWIMQWYPETPIGFEMVAASSLAALDRYFEELEKKDG